MPTIVKTPSAKWRAVIRMTGFPTAIKTFRLKKDAEDWVGVIRVALFHRLQRWVKRPSPAFATLAHQALDKTPEVQMQLRAFSGLPSQLTQLTQLTQLNF